MSHMYSLINIRSQEGALHSIRFVAEEGARDRRGHFAKRGSVGHYVLVSVRNNRDTELAVSNDAAVVLREMERLYSGFASIKLNRDEQRLARDRRIAYEMRGDSINSPFARLDLKAPNIDPLDAIVNRAFSPEAMAK